ncbi:MAG: hypothetical protein U0R78_05005 [Nocardioidaceae bacterium]
MNPITALQASQAGVITRGQVLDLGGTPSDIARRLRHRDWARLLPGVFLDHTGEPTWLQRAWAGVLFHEPAALAGRSAIRAAVGPGWRRHRDGDPIEIAVPQDRHVRARPGFVIVRPSRFEERVQWNASPPRLRLEQAGLDLALAAPSEFALVGLLADLCQTRRTTAVRLLEALDGRQRVPQRAFVRGVLGDIAAGTCSVLERGYLERVQRAHGLPRGARQVPTGWPRSGFRDVDYGGLVVELDGRLFHDSAEQRDRDLDRDLFAAVVGDRTVRLGWGQVFDRPCQTAAAIAGLLVAAGWHGRPRACGPECVSLESWLVPTTQPVRRPHQPSPGVAVEITPRSLWA